MKLILDEQRRQLAQAEAANDAVVAKLRGCLAHMDGLVRDREERDAAMISVINESQAHFRAGVDQVANEVQGILANLTGKAKQIDGQAVTQAALPGAQQQ